MTRSNWLRLRDSAVSAAVLFVFFSVCVVSESGAQSAQPIFAGSSRVFSGPSTFLVAPSLPLAYSPTSVAMSDLSRDGKPDLVTASYDSGVVTVFLATGNGAFSNGVDYAAGPHPSSLLVADINGDGRPDVIVSNESDSTISVLLGNGDGTLRARQSYAVGFNPTFVAAGDFTGSGRMDLAVAGASGNLLAIFLNDGSGGFNKPIVSLLGKTPTALTVKDFNNDGQPDLALSNSDGTVSILLGKGQGLFRSLPDIQVAPGLLSSIAFGDFNKDGKIDLVVAQPDQKQVSVLFGNGDGTFALPASYAVGNAPASTLVADVDGDGVADLVVISKTSNTFSVLGGIGNGAFKTSVDFVAGNTPLAAVAGDFYGNGHVDLAIINSSSQSLTIPSGNGDGTFMAARSYTSGQRPVSIASGYLSGSKIPAMVVANYCGSDSSCTKGGNVAVLLADNSGSYRLASTYGVGAGPVSVVLADVNGDGIPDVVAANRLDKTVSVLRGVGDGTFGQQITFSLSSAPVALAIGDFNKDGNPDLAVLEDCGAAKCTQPGSLEVLLGSGGGNFQPALSYPVGYSPSSLVVGDITGNSNLSLIVANRCGNDASCLSPGTASVLFGDGAGKFKAGKDLALGNSPSSIALGNLSGSGVLDLVVTRATDNAVAVLRGNGDGSFQGPVPYMVGAAPGSVAVADFNGDGKPDVAVTNLNDSTVSVLFGNGDGTLQPAASLPVATGPVSLNAVGGALGGHASLAVANGSASFVSTGSNVTVLASLRPRAFGVTANTTTLTATPNTVNVNQSVTLNVTVAGGSGTPTGTVDITGNGTPAAVCTGLVLDGTGAASCTTSALQANTTTLTATYNGDLTYAITTGTASVTVNKLSPTISLSAPSPASPSALNTSVTFTATLAGVTFTPVVPGGTVSFSVGGTPITGCTAAAVNSSQQATCTTASLPVGVDSITATYSGDVDFNTAASLAASYTITAATRTISFTPAASPASPSALNTAVTFTAQLSGTFTPVLPSGSMTFLLNGSAATCVGAGSNSIAVNSSGVAACQIQNMPAGTGNVVSATYSGDSNYTVAGSASAPAYTITKLSPTISVSPSPASPQPLNTSVTFTATLAGVAFTPVAPGGTVAFSAGGTAITGCTASAVNAARQAICTTSSLAAGSNSITAVYTGDSNFNTATSSALPYTISAAHPTVSVSPSPASPSAVNTDVTFTASLTGVALTPTLPSGTMTFALNGTTIASCTHAVNSAGVATCAIQDMQAGSNTVTATYSGDASYAVTNPGSASYTVTALTPTLGLSALPASSVSLGTSVTFTAQLAGAALTPVVPAGTVTFTVNGAPSSDCPAVHVNASGAATCTTSSLIAPADVITATYSGDANFVVAAPATMTETIGKIAAQTVLVSSPASPSVNQQVVFTATVTKSGGGSSTVVPTGSVAFTQGGTTLCSAAGLSAAGTATCPHVFTSVIPAPGSTITATYSGDSNFSAGAPGTVQEIVQKSSTTLSVTSSTGATSVATESVTFTATVTPTPTGSIAPTGTIAFSSSDGTLNGCSAAPLTAAGNGTSTATCSVAFPLTASGQVNVNASYAGDANFSSGTAAGSHAVQNFSVAFSVQPTGGAAGSGPVTLTQGFANATDPFVPTQVSAVSIPASAFSDSLAVTCVVTNASMAVVSDPSCSPQTATLIGSGNPAVTYTLSASSAASVGVYSITLTAVDSRVPTLTHLSSPLSVYVLGVAGTLNLAPSAVGTETASFDTATPPSGIAPTSLSGITCGAVINTANGAQIAAGQVTCSSSSASVTVTGTQTSVPVTIATLGATTAQLRRSSTIFAAAFMGIPLFALLGWFGSRKSPRRNFFRFIGLILLTVCLSYATGCGGSFTRPPPPGSGGIAAGSYLVQVVATDQNGAKYYAVVPLVVN
jgi:hypothetical protein